MRLNKEIQSNDPDIFGTFAIDNEVQKFLEKFEPNTETLFGWIQLTQGRAHAVGPWLGTNAATLLNRISQEYFAGKDLSDTTLTDVDLGNADLRNTRLDEARLTGASLLSSRFFRRDIALAKISDTEISFYVLKTSQTSKDDPIDFYDSLSSELKRGMNVGIMVPSSFREDLLFELIATVNSIEQLESYRRKLSTVLSTEVAVYFDECEEIVGTQDSVKLRSKPRPLPKPSR